MNKENDLSTNLIYTNIISWINGFIEEKFSFRVMLTNFDSLYRQLKIEQSQLEKSNDEKRQSIIQMKAYIDKRKYAIYQSNNYFTNQDLRNELKKLIHNNN